MNKTLLNHFTVIQPSQHEVPDEATTRDNSLPALVRDLRNVLLQAEQDLLSPRAEAVEQLLSKALS